MVLPFRINKYLRYHWVKEDIQQRIHSEFVWKSRTEQANVCWQKSEQWFPVWNKNLLEWGTIILSEVIEMFYILVAGVGYKSKTHQIVQLRSVHFTVGIFYLHKKNVKKKSTSISRNLFLGNNQRSGQRLSLYQL